MGYVLQVKGGSTQTDLINGVESQTFRFINSLPLTDGLESLIHCCNVASLCIIYRYFHCWYSFELASCMPSPDLRTEAKQEEVLLIVM